MTEKDKTYNAYNAIRNTVAIASEPELFCIQLTGTQASDVLDIVCPCDVFLQDGQMKHSLFLKDNGVPFADVYVCREGSNFYLMGYGINSKELSDWIKSHTKKISDFAIEELNHSFSAIALDGSYCWELCSDVFGPEIMGLPYLGMIKIDTLLIFRAGRTGEYGYHILIPNSDKDSWLDKFNRVGKKYDMHRANKTAREQCVLENFFFDITREGSYNLTPFELQLQWRLSRQKETYPGAKAIHKIRQSGWTKRIVSFTAKDILNPGDIITTDDDEAGKVLSIGYSPVRKDYIGKALMKKPYWHAGLPYFQVGKIKVETVSAPVIANLSLKINPYLHSYHTRNEGPEN